MTQFAGTTFGLGTQHPYSQSFPQTFAGSAIGGLQPWQQGGLQPWQQIVQLLHVVPQQLQQLQAVQQQQVLQLQLLLQIVPAQLQQLQQLIQIVPQQIQHLQQQGQPFGPAIAGPLGFGVAPHVFGGQSAGHVM